jgi:hypothetical protein
LPPTRSLQLIMALRWAVDITQMSDFSIFSLAKYGLLRMRGPYRMIG